MSAAALMVWASFALPVLAFAIVVLLKEIAEHIARRDYQARIRGWLPATLRCDLFRWHDWALKIIPFREVVCARCGRSKKEESL